MAWARYLQGQVGVISGRRAAEACLAAVAGNPLGVGVVLVVAFEEGRLTPTKARVLGRARAVGAPG